MQAGDGLDYLNQSLGGDSGESAEHQNADNNMDSDDCLCHFRWEEKLLEIWQANSCVTLGQRTYLYFCPCSEIVVALSLKIMGWWNEQNKCQGHTASSAALALVATLTCILLQTE